MIEWKHMAGHGASVGVVAWLHSLAGAPWLALLVFVLALTVIDAVRVVYVTRLQTAAAVKIAEARAKGPRGKERRRRGG